MAFVDFMQRIRAHDCDTVDTHRFQPIQLGSKWVEKVDQLSQLTQPNPNPNPTQLLSPLEHNLKVMHILIHVFLQYSIRSNRDIRSTPCSGIRNERTVSFSPGQFPIVLYKKNIAN